MSKTPGKIQICATPIGNLGDVTKRLEEALASADIIYAEDTRVASKLLSALEMPKKPVKRLDENTMNSGLQELKADAEEGRNVAYVSDAGMPGISDPGMKIVELARNEVLDLEVLPGPSAASLAYVYSGFDSPDFYFAGFLPRKEQQIIERLESLKNLQAALIFYESPKRIIKSLEIVGNLLPNRNLCLCRELTKLHEDIIVGTAEEVKANLLDKFSTPEQVKGEICLVIDADNELEKADDDIKITKAQSFLKNLKGSNLSNKDKTKLLAKYLGLNKNTAYDLVLKEGK